MADNALGKFQVYPRGFLGEPLGVTIDKPNQPFYDKRNGLTFDMNIFEAQSTKLPFNQDVEKLFQQLVKRENKTSRMSFRESILLAAIKAFGTMDFFAWYRVQRFSPLFGHTHQKFLEDTIRFISTGQRECSLDTWESLLTSAASDDETRQPEVALVKSFFGLDSQDRPVPGTAVNSYLLGVIQNWVSKPYGFDDLLFSMKILFGSANG